MRIAIVSDIHGNWTALQAVINDLATVGADLVVNGGDLAGSGARSADVVDLVSELGWPGVVGNTDEVLWRPDPLIALRERHPSLRALWDIVSDDVGATRDALGGERIRRLHALPDQWSDHGVTVVHASPGDCWNAPAPTARDDEVERVYGNVKTPLVVYGHVHQPFIRRVPAFVLASSGSVGLPYDGDPRSSYLVVEDGHPTIRRVEYDVEAEIRTLAERRHPNREWIGAMLRTGSYIPPV